MSTILWQQDRWHSLTRGMSRQVKACTCSATGISFCDCFRIQTHQHYNTPVQDASVIFEAACRTQHWLLQLVATIEEIKKTWNKWNMKQKQYLIWLNYLDCNVIVLYLDIGIERFWVQRTIISICVCKGVNQIVLLE